MRCAFVRGLFLLSGLFAFAAFAEDADLAMEELIVTATKREQAAQELGISLNVIDEAALWDYQIETIGEVAEKIPNIVQSFSDNLQSFSIRGVGMTEFAGNFDAPVAIHLDEVYFSKPYMSSIGFFDLQQVEALMGPQGTLFGRNTTVVR